jgi:sugar phosphate isomerase/epimerase
MSIKRREFLEKGAALLASGLAMPLRLEGGARGRAERIHIGAQTNAFGNPMRDYQELLKVLDTLEQLHYSGFETNFRSLDSEAARATQCRRDFEARQMQLIALHCSYGNPEKVTVATQIENLRRIAACSAAMGAHYQIVSGGSVYGSSGNLDPQAAHIWTDGLNKVGEAVKKEGVTLCYHNHRTEFEGHPSLMSYILRDTDPNLVRLNFDVGHPIGLMDPAVFSRENYRRIAIYHIKDTILDSSGKIVHVDLGKGRVNLQGVVAPLLDSDWSGWLEIEEDRDYPKPLEHPAETLREDRQYLKRITGV